MAIKQILLFSISSLVVRVSAAPAEPSRGQIGTSFKFYVWGNGIPGLPLFYADGAAVFTDYATASATDNLVPLTFNTTARQNPPPGLERMGYSFTASPDPSAPVSNPATKSPPFTTTTLYVSDRGSSPAHDVGFTPSQSTTGLRLGGFMLSERRFFSVEDSGSVKPSLYCAFPSREREGVWELKWNVTSSGGGEGRVGVPVTLRNMPYPKNTKAEWYFGTECRTGV